MSFTGDSGTLGALADVGEADKLVEEPRRRGKRFGRRRRREIGLAYLLILPVAAHLRGLRLLSVLQELLSRLLQDAAVPRAAVALRGLRPVLRRPHLPGLRRQPQDDRRLRVPHRARRHRARARPRGAREPAAARCRDLPHDLLVDGRHVGRGRRGDLRHAVQPGRRAAALDRDQSQSTDPRQPRPRAVRRRDHHDLADARASRSS